MGKVFIERIEVGDFYPESPYLPGWVVMIDTLVIGYSDELEPSGSVYVDSLLVGSYLLPSYATVRVT